MPPNDVIFWVFVGLIALLLSTFPEPKVLDGDVSEAARDREMRK